MSKINIFHIKQIVKTILIAIIIILIPATSISQTTPQGYVNVKGKIRFEKKGLSGVTIEVYDGPSKTNTITSESTGRFKFKLRLDKIYIIYFKKKDFVTKKVEFNTAVDEKDIMWEYQFDLELFEMMDGLDISVLDNPVAKVVYDEKIGDFDFDESYSQKIKSNIAKMMNQQKALKAKQYSTLIASADNNYRNKNYEKAIELYEKALDIDPYADYPFNQIDKCDEMLKRPVVNEDDYKKAVQLADAEFNNKNYDKAITLYENALDIDPYNDYPDNQIDKCEKLLSLQKNSEKSYNDAIANADKYFASKKYETAKTNYKEASSIKPSEQYPKDKIVEIDKLLSDLALQNKKEELDKDYNIKIVEADKLLKQSNLKDAKQKYNEAIAIKSTEQYPKDKIVEIDKLIAQKEEANSKKADYDKLIVDGDRYFKSNQYDDAKNKYQAALEIIPGEIYPKEKVTEINKILQDLAEKSKNDKAYQELISSADIDLNNKKLDDAKGKYNEALKIKPKESYPKTKLAEIDKLIAEAKAKEEAAAKELAAKEAAAAASLAAKQKLDADYKELISEADGMLKSKSYNDAKGKYNEALKLKQEQYPKDKIAEIDKLITEAKAKEEAAAKELAAKEAAAAAALATKQKLDADYKELISEADGMLKSKSYNDAKGKYNEALKLKQEQYPKDKIAEIDKLIAEAKAKEDANAKELAAKEAAAAAALATKQKLDADYKELISEADGMLKSKSYNDAKGKYNEALKLKQEQYPKDKIAEIDKLIAEAKAKEDADAKELAAKEAAAAAALASKQKLDADYKKLISEADGMLKSKSYNDAKGKYNEALKLKQEQYPKDKIAEINKLIAQIEKDKANYSKLITDGDRYFKSKQYDDAKNKYQSALSIKSEETYPKDKIAEIDKLVAEAKAKEDAEKVAAATALAAKQKIDADYKKLITEADTKLKSKSYDEAKGKYNEALKLKQEQYPKDKIVEIDKLIAEAKSKEKAEKAAAAATLAAKQKLDADYKKLITEADTKLKSKSYDEAKSKYNEALKLKQEQYPKDKIVEIDKLIAEVKAKEEAEKAAAATALAAKQKLDANYKKLITEADTKLKGKSYDEAKSKYNEALKLKQEQYPKDKIVEIDKLIAEAKAKEEAEKVATAAALAAKQKLDADYKKLITEADTKLKGKSYDEAKAKYNEALKLKQEQYPKDKIVEIDKLIAEAKAKEEAEKAAVATALAAKQKLDTDYKKLITEADGMFGSKSYSEAKGKYNEALKLKQEQYPKDKIVEIDKFLAEKAKEDALNKKYNDLLAQGNKLMKEIKYDDAKAKYNEALKLKPDSDYPKTKIAEIEKLKAQRVIDKKYLAEVKKADELFNAKKYTEAKSIYGSASKIKPSENYPKKQILEIQNILSGQTADNAKPKEDPKLKDLSKLSSAEKSHYLNSLAKKYPKGKTTEEYSESNGKKITRVIMSDGNIAHEYRKVKQPWGAVYYFKDGKNISNAIFFQETQE